MCIIDQYLIFIASFFISAACLRATKENSTFADDYPDTVFFIAWNNSKDLIQKNMCNVEVIATEFIIFVIIIISWNTFRIRRN